MIVLGVDPGLRHTGYAVLRDGRPVETGVLVPPGALSLEVVIRFVTEQLRGIVHQWKPEYAAVEQVAWFGRQRRVTMPLSHIAGAIAGFLLGRGVSTCLLLPTMKGERRIKIPRMGRSWSEHEKDAFRLATIAHEYAEGLAAGAGSSLRKLSAVERRFIIAPTPARGKR